MMGLKPVAGGAALELRPDATGQQAWKPEDKITQHAGWGPATPPAKEVRRLMRKREINGAVLRGAAPLEPCHVIADNALDTRATLSHMQLTHNCNIASNYTHKTYSTPWTTDVPFITYSYITDRFRSADALAHYPPAPMGL